MSILFRNWNLNPPGSSETGAVSAAEKTEDKVTKTENAGQEIPAKAEVTVAESAAMPTETPVQVSTAPEVTGSAEAQVKEEVPMAESAPVKTVAPVQANEQVKAEIPVTESAATPVETPVQASSYLGTGTPVQAKIVTVATKTTQTVKTESENTVFPIGKKRDVGKGRAAEDTMNSRLVMAEKYYNEGMAAAGSGELEAAYSSLRKAAGICEERTVTGLTEEKREALRLTYKALQKVCYQLNMQYTEKQAEVMNAMKSETDGLKVEQYSLMLESYREKQRHYLSITGLYDKKLRMLQG